MGHPDWHDLDSQRDRIGVCLLHEISCIVAIISPSREGADQDHYLLGDEILRSILAVSRLSRSLCAPKQEFHSEWGIHRVLRHHDRAHKKCGEHRRLMGESVAGQEGGKASG